MTEQLLPRAHGGHVTAEGFPKRQYTKKEARRALKRIVAQGGSVKMHAYLCHECGWWHTGTRYLDKV